MKYRFNYILAFFFAGTIGFSACKKTPEYSFTPAITVANPAFTDVRLGIDSTTLVLTEYVNINIHFTDGDGDLGLDQTDINNSPGTKNFYLYQFRKKRGLGAYVQDSTYLGQFPLLSPKEVKGPVDGTLKQLFLFNSSDYFDNDKVYFKINISDRAGNMSNQVTTPEFTVDFTP